MAERSTLGLAHQLLDLLRENQEQAVSVEHARILVNLARALVRPQDAHEDMSGDYETGIALDLPGPAVDGPLSPALVKTPEPIIDAALTSAAFVKTPEPPKDEYEMETRGVAELASSSLEHLDASTRSTYQPSATVNTENDDSSASPNTTLSTNRTLHDSNAQKTSLDAPLLPPAVVVSTMPALVQPPKCAVSAELEPNVVPTLCCGHQHLPAAPGAASSTTVSPRLRDDATSTTAERMDFPALPPLLPPSELSPITKQEDTPILLLANYPSPLPLQDHERASPPAWVKTEHVDSPGLSSLPIGDETNASALPMPNSTYPLASSPPGNVKIEPFDSPALFSLPLFIASVRRPLVTTVEEGNSSTPLENATAPRVLVKTELIEEDTLAVPPMHLPRNGGLHLPSSNARSARYHYSHTPTFQRTTEKREPVDAFIPAIQPSPTDTGDAPIAHSAEHLPASMPAGATMKAEHEDVDLAYEQEPLSSLAPTAGGTPPLVKAEPVEPSIGISSTDEADTPILRLAKYPPAPTSTAANDGDVHTTHMPSVPSSLVTAASSNAARNYYIPVPSTDGDFLTEHTALETTSAPPSNATAAVENAAYDDEIHLPTTPGDSLPGQTVLEILSAPASLKSSPSSGATSAIPVVHPHPRVGHVESEALAAPSVPSIFADTRDEREASNPLSNADADGVDTNRSSTRSPSPSACSIAPPNIAPPSHTTNSSATTAAEYANVFMLAAWSDDETSPVANAQQQDLFPPVPPPTPTSSSSTSPNVPPSPSPSSPAPVSQSPSPSPAAPVLSLQTTPAEASYDIEAPMDVDEGAASRAPEGECTETEDQEDEHHVPRLLLRMSSPVTAPTQGQHDDATRTEGPAHETLDDEADMSDADRRAQEEEEAYVPSLLRRMSGLRYDSNACATEQQGEVADNSTPSTSSIFLRLGDVQTVSGRASLRSRFAIPQSPPPPPPPLAERISPPSSVRAEHHGHSSFKRRHREDGMEDGESAVGRSGLKRRRRK